ncbi:hypothetical protein MiAbW_02675 [Microcystis aeruginosa NIES-4325]|uniref:DUF29 domain-containing protein n=1 Tax=Microcystis aeruginosa NIES-4325 TaxID=2569534 RepID=A0A5J4FAQ7_MICAE|nr:hypothetical protein MiAbW_02675 [Microcystis aeruginosa NIES-4325]
MKTKLSQLYETDFNLWLEQTVNHLKKGNLEHLDLDIAFPVRKRYIIDVEKSDQQRFKCATQV